MGDAERHLRIAEEKLAALRSAFDNKQYTVVGDLATKVCEQLVEASAADEGLHFGTHTDRHNFSNEHFPRKVNDAMRKLWFAYGDLGYDGINGKRAKMVLENLRIILSYFREQYGDKVNLDI